MAKPDWISLNKTSGNGNQTIEVQCSENTGEPRNGSINIVTTRGITKTVNIFQKASDKTIINFYTYYNPAGKLQLKYEVQNGKYIEENINFQLITNSGNSTIDLNANTNQGTITTDLDALNLTNIQIGWGNNDKYKAVVVKTDISIELSNYTRNDDNTLNCQFDIINTKNLDAYLWYDVNNFVRAYDQVGNTGHYVEFVLTFPNPIKSGNGKSITIVEPNYVNRFRSGSTNINNICYNIIINGLQITL